MVKIKIVIVALIILFGIVTCINPLYPNQQVLQHIGTVLLLIPLIIDLKYNKLLWGSFIGISIYTILHIIGARYIYSYVPYNEWIKSIFNIDINSYFGFTRNGYDRFVHFAFGILVFPYFMQQVSKWKGLSVLKAIIVVWLIIQTISMLYELFEWSLTMVMSKDVADNYNGQQGDIWDAQKDMALALFGSTIMAIIYYFRKRKV